MRRAQFERIQILLEQKRYAMARQELEEILALNAIDPLAHALMAHCLLDLDLSTLALKHARESIGLAPDVGFCYYTLGIVLQEQGALRQAREQFKQALALDPEDPDYFVRLGLTYIQDYRWQEALNCAEQALALFPEHVDATNLRSMALMRMGQTEQAAENLEQALQREPENARIHANRGWTQLHQGQQTAALTSFAEALRLEPELDWARDGMLEALKARYWIYRSLQRYFFWMSRHGRKYQFLIMIGIIVVMRGITRVSGMYSSSLTIGLILVYFVFVVLTWLADPLFNLILSFHPDGRHVLSSREKTVSRWLGVLLASSLLFIVSGLVLKSPVFLLLSGLNFMMLVPLAGSQAASKPRARRILGAYTAMLTFLALGVVLCFQLLPSLTVTLGLAFLVGWLMFSWYANWLILKA